MIDFIKKYIKSYIFNTENVTFQFDLYNYNPQTIKDEREKFYIKINELHLLDELYEKAKKENKELAIISKFKCDKKYFHFGFIDASSENLNDIINFTKEVNMENEFHILNSGRSFHLYHKKLIMSHKKWVEYNALLLLDKNNVIDHRWIGHRLLGGYSSLRITCNTSHYKQLPKLIL